MGKLRYKEFGSVISKKQCVCTVDGLDSCTLGQLVFFDNGSKGCIIGFNEQVAQVLLLEEHGIINAGDKVQTIMEEFRIPVGKNFIGRIMTSLGYARDGMGPITADDYYPVWCDAPGVMDRAELDSPLETGIKIIDSMIPIGRGQRELITGDRMSGKTCLGTDAIISQVGGDMICIYVDIGKPEAAIKKVSDLLRRTKAFEHTVIVSAGASATQGEQYLAPYVACSVGEFFMRKGKHVLVIFDDFSKHAWAYREISLLLNRPPGRNAYPGDIFYLHSKMIERAGNLNEKLGKGSMTFLPFVETLENDITSYICSNLVSMTDGQIVLNTELFADGFKPAIDLGLSVSRVGTKVQWPLMKKLTSSYRLDFLQYKELLLLTKLNKSDLTKEIELKLKKGEIFLELVQQGQDAPVPFQEQVLLYYAYNEDMLLTLTADQVKEYKKDVGAFARENHRPLLDKMRKEKKMSDELKKMLDACINDYLKRFIKVKSEKKSDDESTEKSEGAAASTAKTETLEAVPKQEDDAKAET